MLCMTFQHAGTALLQYNVLHAVDSYEFLCMDYSEMVYQRTKANNCNQTAPF